MIGIFTSPQQNLRLLLLFLLALFALLILLLALAFLGHGTLLDLWLLILANKNILSRTVGIIFPRHG